VENVDGRRQPHRPSRLEWMPCQGAGGPPLAPAALLVPSLPAGARRFTLGELIAAFRPTARAQDIALCQCARDCAFGARDSRGIA